MAATLTGDCNRGVRFATAMVSSSNWLQTGNRSSRRQALCNVVKSGATRKSMIARNESLSTSKASTPR